MGIQVSDKFWFSKDGSWYRHPKFNKFGFDWKKIKALAEGELILSAEGQSESVDQGKEKENASKKKGKEKMPKKVKKKHHIRTGGKFEIKEGEGNIYESESESESEPFVPHTTYGESSHFSLRSVVEKLVDQQLDAVKRPLVESILDYLKEFQFVAREIPPQSNLPPSPLRPPSPARPSSPSRLTSPAKEDE